MFYSGGNFELSTVPQGLVGFQEGVNVEGLRCGQGLVSVYIWASM